jgi:hypothetical protein
MQLTDFKSHLLATYGITDSDFERLHEEFLSYFGQTVEEFVSRRHQELQKTGRKNDEIYRLIQAEATARRFAVQDLSERQIRRIVYG